jgi:hypothetical protein
MFIRTEVAFIGRSRQAARSPMCVDGSSYESYCERSTRDEDFGATAPEHQKKKVPTSRNLREKRAVERK